MFNPLQFIAADSLLSLQMIWLALGACVGIAKIVPPEVWFAMSVSNLFSN